jgi:hypothetical protein
MFIITGLKWIGKQFAKFFRSKEAQEMLAIVFTKILPEAKPIVENIRSIIGSPSQATVPQIMNLYEQMGKTAGLILDNPAAKGHAILDLASELVSAAIPDRYETPLIHSAIELALAGIKAEAK